MHGNEKRQYISFWQLPWHFVAVLPFSCRSCKKQMCKSAKGEWIMMIGTMLLATAGILLLIVLGIVIWVIGSYNGFIKLRNKTEEAFSALDISLKKRYDLIPNYVETVKGYAKYESETLEQVIRARNRAMNASSHKERIEKDNVLSGSLHTLFALSENYPDLKASENFIRLQEQLARIEEEIAGARRYYNGIVNRFNTKTEMFPGSLIAGIFHFERMPLYEVNSREEREKVNVSF